MISTLCCNVLLLMFYGYVLFIADTWTYLALFWKAATPFGRIHALLAALVVVCAVVDILVHSSLFLRFGVRWWHVLRRVENRAGMNGRLPATTQAMAVVTGVLIGLNFNIPTYWSLDCEWPQFVGLLAAMKFAPIALWFAVSTRLRCRHNFGCWFRLPPY